MAAERRTATPASVESARGTCPRGTPHRLALGPTTCRIRPLIRGVLRGSHLAAPRSVGSLPTPHRARDPRHLHSLGLQSTPRPAPAPRRVSSPAPGRLLMPAVPLAARPLPRGARPEALDFGSASTSRGLDLSAQCRSRTEGGRLACRGAGTVRRTGRGGAVSCGWPSPARPQARPQTLLQPSGPSDPLALPHPDTQPAGPLLPQDRPKLLK